MEIMTQKHSDKIFDIITINGCKEMDKTRFRQAVNELLDIYTDAKLSKIAKKIENQKEKIAPCESDEEMWNDGLDRAIIIIKTS